MCLLPCHPATPPLTPQTQNSSVPQLHLFSEHDLGSIGLTHGPPFLETSGLRKNVCESHKTTKLKTTGSSQLFCNGKFCLVGVCFLSTRPTNEGSWGQMPSDLDSNQGDKKDRAREHARGRRGPGVCVRERLLSWVLKEA